jgi:hypothetical protein
MIRTAFSLALLVVLAGCGGGRQKGTPSTGLGASSTARVPPEWVNVATLTGSANASETVEVPRAALQWRTRWQCRSGNLTLVVSSATGGPPMRVDETCPSIGKAVWAGIGEQQLTVRATDRWRVVVEKYTPGASG